MKTITEMHAEYDVRVLGYLRRGSLCPFDTVLYQEEILGLARLIDHIALEGYQVTLVQGPSGMGIHYTYLTKEQVEAVRKSLSKQDDRVDAYYHSYTGSEPAFGVTLVPFGNY